MFRVIGRGLAPIGRAFLRWGVLPLYRLFVAVNLRLQHLTLPTRNLALVLVSSRYLFHVVIAVATIATVVINVRARQVSAQDVGQNSLLYALATDSDVEIIRETAPESPAPTNVSYLAHEALIAVPHIDFDYNDAADEVADLSVPGTISALPLPDHTPSSISQPARTSVETYVVKEGDTIGSIANSFGVNVGTLLWSNSLNERQFIRPGDSLKIPPVSGVLVTIKKGDTLASLAQRYDGSEEEIRHFNKIVDDSTLALGTEIMIPGGRPSAPETTLIAISSQSRQKTVVPTPPKSKTVSREDSGDQEPTLPSEPAPTTQKPADADPKKTPNTRLLWPTNGHVITQYYGWKHTGLDIDGDFTSPLYAALEGEVTTAGWNTGGYGLQVMIKHPNGMVTRYAHASKLFVKVGEKVKKGQVIAMMGSTGHSTGSHLHFEVYANGKRTNPLTYIR